MGFVSFIGRVLFASIFILSAWQEFNEFEIDGGPAAKALSLKFDTFTNRVISRVGVQIPNIEIKQLVAADITLKGIGGVLFIFSNTFGAYLLLLHLGFSTPILYDFYNFSIENPEFIQLFTKFIQNVALFGALLFFLGMKNSILRRSHRKKVHKTKTS